RPSASCPRGSAACRRAASRSATALVFWAKAAEQTNNESAKPSDHRVRWIARSVARCQKIIAPKARISSSCGGAHDPPKKEFFIGVLPRFLTRRDVLPHVTFCSHPHAKCPTCEITSLLIHVT